MSLTSLEQATMVTDQLCRKWNVIHPHVPDGDGWVRLIAVPTTRPDRRRKPYPTWVKKSACRFESEEGFEVPRVGFVPDFILLKENGLWWSKWRISSQWDGPFQTPTQAKQDVARQLKGTEELVRSMNK